MISRVFSLAALLVTFVFLNTTVASADVEDFTFESWTATYELSLNDRGRVTAEVTEDVVAVFPDYDQNRGIIRSLMLTSFDARTAPTHVRVTDGDGVPVPFQLEDDDDFRYIIIGDNRFVHGPQRYIITYDLPDVIAPMPVEGSEELIDEFYWDLIPVDRQQTVESFSTTIHLSDELSEHLTGFAACYTGRYGSEEPCDMELRQGSSFVIPAFPLERHQGVTVAIGFSPGAVTQPPARVQNWWTDAFPYIPLGFAIAASIASGIMIRVRAHRSRTASGVIIPHYDVPRNLPPMLSAQILKTWKDPVPAQFIHLAVNGVVTMRDGSSSPMFQLQDPTLVGDPLDEATLRLMFSNVSGSTTGSPPTPQTFTIPKRSTIFGDRVLALKSRAKKEAETRGYLTRERNRAAIFMSLIAVGLALVGALAALPGVLVGRVSSDLPLTIGIVLLTLLSIAAMFVAQKHQVHTTLGAETREYLLGVRKFISIAEQDRLQMLQSFSGAERQTQSANGDPFSVIHVYEKLLPYAMLCGLEKEWARVLQVKYSESHAAPLWYAGAASASLGQLELSMRSLQNSVQSAASRTSAASHTTSGTSGSTGGGFVGGGGGGGSVGGR